jgi:hypothetical protein
VAPALIVRGGASSQAGEDCLAHGLCTVFSRVLHARVHSWDDRSSTQRARPRTAPQVRNFRRSILSASIDRVPAAAGDCQVYALCIRGTAFLWHQVGGGGAPLVDRWAPPIA